MALVRSGYDFPDLWKRWLTPDFLGSWLRVEEFLDGETLVVRAELPGLDPDKDVELTVSNGTLHIQAERQEKSEKKSKDGYRSEFHYGSFQRTIPLPVGTNDEDVKASYVDGILEIRVPVGPTKSASTKVPVNRG